MDCKEMLLYLKEERAFSMSEVERVLEVPQGCLTEIIKGRIPLPEERAMVGILYKHPWILEAFDDITRMMVKNGSI